MKAGNASTIGTESVLRTVPAMVVVCLPDRLGCIDMVWLDRLKTQIPTASFKTIPRLCETTGLEAQIGLHLGKPQWLELLYPHIEQPTLLIESGLELPPYFTERLSLLTPPSQAQATVFPGNYSPHVNPLNGLNAPLSDQCQPLGIDSLIWNLSQGAVADIDPHLSTEARVIWVDPANRSDHTPESEVKLVMSDLCFVRDPTQPLQSPASLTPLVTRLFGRLCAGLNHCLAKDITELHYMGLDDRPVTLHINHDWGGGTTRWIADVCQNDPTSHHLVLVAKASKSSAFYGQSLHLYASGPDQAHIQHYDLNPVIGDTVCAHEGYQQFLNWIIRHFGVGRIIVSSLIGHSLDCLAQPIPTAQVLHDFYLASPVLDVDPLDYLKEDGAVDLGTLIADNQSTFKFPNTHLSHWAQLRDHWLSRVKTSDVRLIAPSQPVVDRWNALFSFDLPSIKVIPHGFDRPSDWPSLTTTHTKASDTQPLRLVTVGRMSSGKGLHRLLEASRALGSKVHWTILGGGYDAMRAFGQKNLDVIFDYDMETLPAHLENIAPDAVVFLSRVPETWNYVLSEVWSLGLTPIAPALGSFQERIHHGQDGFLYESSTEGLIELLEHLITGTEHWLEPFVPPREPSLAEAIAVYDQHIPAELVTSYPNMFPLRDPCTYSLQADLLTQKQKALDQSHDEIEKLHATIRDQASMLDRLDRTLKERTAWAVSLQQSIRSNDSSTEAEEVGETTYKSQRTAELESENKTLRGALRQAQHEVSQLDGQLSEMAGSRSWKLTRPLRVTSRLLIALHQRKAWLPSNWPRQSKRLVHAIQLHGWRATLEAVQQRRAESHPPHEVLVSTNLPNPQGPHQPVRLDRLESLSQPNISIIVPVFNNVAYTAHCLNSIKEHDAGESFEVIVVNDCSTDETKEYLGKCRGVRVIHNPSNLGFIGSCNVGALQAQGEYLVFLNNDTEVTAGWLTALISTFENHDNVGIVGAKLVYPDGSLQEAGGIIFNDGSGWNYGRGGSPQASTVEFVSDADYVSGACLAISRERFTDLAGFDSLYSPAYYEDTDLCFKVRDQGARIIYQPKCAIIHFEGVSNGTSESSGIKRYQAINRTQFTKRWAHILANHPKPVPGPNAIGLIEKARHHSKKGHIFVVDAVTPQPDQDSGSVRMMTLLELLVEMGYRVTFAPSNLAWDGEYTQALRDRGIETLHHPEISSIKKWLERYGGSIDWVIGSRYYVLDDIYEGIRSFCPNANIIFDTVDLHFLREQRRATLENDAEMAKVAAKTEAKELALIEKCDITLVVSPVEQTLLREKNRDAHIEILSNIHSVTDSVAPFENRSGLLFVGGFQHPPNVDAARWLIDEILPKLLITDPSIELHLIGSKMPDWLKATRAPGLRNHGFVHDLTPYLTQCRVAVAPLRYGAGVKGKVNQAMAHGLPVVATSAAAEGIYALPDRDLLIGNDTETFVQQVLCVYQDAHIWEKLSVHGRKNVSQYFSRQSARQSLEQILSMASSRQNAL